MASCYGLVVIRKLLYPVFGVTVLGGYAFMNLNGIDPGASSTERRALPPAARAAGVGVGGGGAGGAFWYGGYRGGK